MLMVMMRESLRTDYHKLVNYLCVKTKYPILFKHNCYLHSKLLFTIKLVCYNYVVFALNLRIVRIGIFQVLHYDNERVLYHTDDSKITYYS